MNVVYTVAPTPIPTKFYWPCGKSLATRK